MRSEPGQETKVETKTINIFISIINIILVIYINLQVDAIPLCISLFTFSCKTFSDSWGSVKLMDNYYPIVL